MTGKKEKIEPPQLTGRLDLLALSDYEIQDEQSFRTGLFQDCVIRNQAAAKVFVDQVLFKNATFDKVSLQHAEFSDVRFEHCDLSNTDFSCSIFHRVSFKQCKLLGLDLSESTLRNVSFEQCNADYAVLRFANAKHVKFETSSFGQADFFNVTWSHVYFSETHIDQAQFSRTKLAGVDISGCDFYNLGVTPEDLQGCIISSSQAVLFAKLFGLVIKDEQQHTD